MSFNDNDIDEIFREAFENQKVPTYQDSYFDEIENLLPKNKSKKRFYFALSGVSTIILLSLIYSLSTNLNSTKERKIGAISASTSSKKGSPTNSSIPYENKSNIQTSKITEVVSSKYTSTKKANSSNDLIDSRLFFNDVNSKSESKLALIDRIYGENELNESLINNLIASHEIVENNNINTLNFNKIISPIFEIEGSEVSALIFPIKSKKHHIYLDFAFGFSESFVLTKNPTSRPMQTYAIGAGYKYRKSDFAIEVGFGLMNYRPEDLNLNRQSKVYGFEVNKYSQTIDYKWISLLEFPVMISKRHNNHQFGVGIAPSFMIGSVIDFTKTVNEIETFNDRIYANKLGLNNFGLKPQISYCLNLNNKYEIGAKISTNIINSLDKNKFEGQINQLPFQAQFLIRKNISIK